MTIQELKKALGLSNTEIAGFFGLSSAAYANSSAKPRYESAMCKFYEKVHQNTIKITPLENQKKSELD